MEVGTFSLVPIEVIKDKRLTLEQTRVLVALFSFRNKVTEVVWPSRAAIAERTGMHPSNISNATTGLVSLGWLKKDGVGGHSKATRYTLCSPELSATTVAHSATVAEQATVARSATKTVAHSATRPVAHSATRKEQTKEHTKEQTISEAPSAPAAPAPSDAPAVVAFRAEPVIAKPVFPAIDEAVEVEVVKALPAVKAAAAKPARTRKPKADAVPVDETALQAACRAAWGAYSAAYDVRYGALPVRNAKVNAAVKGIVQRLGAEEAPAVAAFFVSNVNEAFVVRACHDIGLLLKSAEAYRTQWATGLAVTQTRARQADQSAANYDAAAEAMALLRARRAARAAQAQQEGI